MSPSGRPSTVAVMELLSRIEPVEPPRLPQNLEAEAALLGALMIDNRLMEDVGQIVQPHHFHEPVHGRIFEAIAKLCARDMIATPVTLRPLLESDPALKELGGAGYLAKLTGNAAAVIGARDFARQLHDLHMLRALISVGRGMVESAMDTGADIEPKDQIEEAERALYEAAETSGRASSTVTFATASKAALSMAEKARNAGGGLAGVTTGLENLNSRLGGLQASDLVILAARPGMGKTSLATNIAFSAAQRYMRDKADGIDPDRSVGATVAFFSLEMSADQLATRVLSEQSGISGEMLRMGKITQSQMHDLARASVALQDLPLYIDDTAALTIGSLHTRARRLQRKHGIGLIIVDYLQLLSGGSSRSDNRVQEISEISRGLKTMAKELQVPVLALSQLSRAVESREDKRPQLSDLRESGSIEQDADIVLFVYREDYYVSAKEPREPKPDDPPEVHNAYEEWKREMEPIYGVTEILISKHRHGATGKARLRFDRQTTKFSDLVDESRLPEQYG